MALQTTKLVFNPQEPALRELTKDNVLSFIKEREAVTFVELTRYFKEAKGDQILSLPGDLRHVVLWSGLSEQMVNILCDLKEKKEIIMWPTSVMVYAIDGGCLNLPIASRRKSKQKKDVWQPIVMYSKEGLPPQYRKKLKSMDTACR